jgi:hypothetical protein
MSTTHLNSQAEMRQLPTPASLERHEALRREVDQLRTALTTRIVIEQAKGMLAERLDIDVNEAFERLRREARNRRLKLHVLAAAVTARETWTEAILLTGAEVTLTTESTDDLLYVPRHMTEGEG